MIAVGDTLNGKEVINHFSVESESSGKIYSVCELSDGSFTCSCPAWIFRRQGCKHIEQAKAKLVLFVEKRGQEIKC